MNYKIKIFLNAFILLIGLILSIISIYNNNLNLALIALSSALIIWVIVGILADIFNTKVFAWALSCSGFLISFSIFFMYGIEEVAYPQGAIVFHSWGFAGALGTALLSLFPLLALYHEGVNPMFQLSREKNVATAPEQTDPDIFSSDWELASEEDLNSDEFEVD